jgi:site-specific recombinase XerD
MNTSGDLSAFLEAFFTDRLMQERQVSQHTVASYRDSFRMLLAYAQGKLAKPPSALRLEELSAPFIGAFLNYLEKTRGNSIRTRNLRLTAIHSFFRYLAFQEPARSAFIQRVLAIPSKRYRRVLIDFLSRPEIDALLQAPDCGTWAGRRDHALLMVGIQTGLRVSELTGLNCQDVILGAGAHVRCQGKGRKERCTPLGKQVARRLGSWLRERAGRPSDPVFPNARGGALSRDGVQYILNKHVSAARKTCSTLERKRVSPHVLRHSTAMSLLASGVDRSVIALWLGHESVETTQIYIDANLALKEKVVDKAMPTNVRKGRFRADDRLMAFLQGL